MNMESASDISKIIESDLKSISEKLFSISEFYSFLFYNDTEGNVPNGFQKLEAKIFSCFWTLRIISNTIPKILDEAKLTFIKGLVNNISPEEMIKIFDSNEFPDFFIRRFKLFNNEVEKMNEENYDYAIIIDKLYLSPLTSSTLINLESIDFTKYLKLCGIFSIGLKHYNQAIQETIRLMLID